MRLGAGAGRTRDDHLEVAAQVYAFAALASRVADLADVVGEAGLTPRDRRFLTFADAYLHELIAQRRDEERTLTETLDRAWRVVSLLPRHELGMISETLVNAHYVERNDESAGAAG